MRVLQTVFRWIQVSYMSRTLKVNHPQAFKEGLYLCFPPYVDFGMVRVGNEDLETQFDIIPAEMGPKTSVKNALYAFLFIQPKGWPKEGKLQWVFWDVDKDEATLMPNLHSYCFVYIWKKIKKSAKANSEAFRLLAARGRGSDMTRKEFRMECNMIKKEDFGLGFPLESPETSFVKEKDRLIKVHF